MAQNYLWKVEYEEIYYPFMSSNMTRWGYVSKVFTSKMSALNYVNRLQNSNKYRKVRLKKWFG